MSVSQGFSSGGYSSSLNSSVSPLSGGATFTGSFESNSFPDISISCISDASGTLYVDFSGDGINYTSFPSNGYSILSGIHTFHIARKALRFFRIRLINGASPQTYLRLFVSSGAFGQPISPVSQSLQDDSDAIVAKTITEESMIAEGKWADRYIVNKFGRNTDIDTGTVPEDIWDGGGTYTGFPAGSAETVSVLSSSANDTAAGTGARTLKIFGLDANFALQSETLTLNGTSPVTSSGTYSRVFRAHIVTAGSGTTNAGNITVRHTTTTSNIFTIIQIGYGQSQVCVYTIPAGYTGYLIGVNASLLDATTNQAIIAMWYREFNGAVRLQRAFVCSTAFPITRNIFGGILIPEKTDLSFRVMSVASSNADVTCTFDLKVIKN